LLDRLELIHKRYEELSQLLCNPEVVNDINNLKAFSKEQASLEEQNQAYLEYKRVLNQYKEAKAMLEEKLDSEMRELVKTEIDELSVKRTELEERIKVLLLPRDPNDEKNVIVEIRGAAGGEEAALFAANLFRMYTRYAERQGWKIELLETNETGIGGFKEVIISIQGRGAYSRFK
jgi:peptide chain release factor 1